MITEPRPQFSLRHAAYMIGVCNKTVRRWIKAGKISGWQYGGRQAWYLDLEEINKMRDVYALPALTPDEAAKMHSEY